MEEQTKKNKNNGNLGLLQSIVNTFLPVPFLEGYLVKNMEIQRYLDEYNSINALIRK